MVQTIFPIPIVLLHEDDAGFTDGSASSEESDSLRTSRQIRFQTEAPGSSERRQHPPYLRPKRCNANFLNRCRARKPVVLPARGSLSEERTDIAGTPRASLPRTVWQAALRCTLWFAFAGPSVA